MKILHINDQAGVACILAKYQRFSGIDSKVILPYRIDKFGIFKFYKEYLDIIEPARFVDYCIFEAKDADIIHIHTIEDLVVKMRKTYGYSKKIILHYHGTDLRGLKNKNNPHLTSMKVKAKFYARKVRNRLRLMKMGYYRSARTESQKLADLLLVSTSDLLSLLPRAKYLPNPVDIEHFSIDKDNIKNKSINSALTIKTETGNLEKTFQFLKDNKINLKVDVFDRTKKPLSHGEIPHLLKKYNLYVDIKIVDDKLLESLSKTGLESLACGLRVLNYKLEYIEELPDVHKPINVINKLQNLYM